MELEKESLTNRIEDDLARRNRNWDKLQDGLTVQDISSSFTRLVGEGGNARFRYIPALNMVWLTWNIIGANITPGENRIARVNSKYPPPATVYSMLIAADSRVAQVHILSNGDIMVYSPESLGTIRGTVTWFLE